VLRSAYKLTIALDGGILSVQASGTYALRRSLAMIAKVRTHAAEFGVKRVVLETSGVPQPIPDLERASLGEAAAREWRGLTVAIVHRAPSRSDAATVVARNRGANVRVFSSPAEAVEWLNGGAAAGSAR
jgi:hypothetical protein